ncbi:MAG: CCA tRNA nucleotidyltransferase [Pseudomonadota bacterium]
MKLDAPWLGSPATQAVVAALGEGALFVGGCVRNTLMEQPVSDIDIATSLQPGEVTRRAEEAELKAIPTGLDHGTVTIVSAGIPFEVTTFRADIATDGRRAVVRFSDDIVEDAARRDFTINALYAEPDGTLVDPLGGLPDLEARRVRFIGEAADRIREDALRILRFFRFNAWYGEGIDAEGLAACADAVGDIAGLARERIGAEMRKLLAAPDPAPAVAAMAASGVLSASLPGANPALLPHLIAREEEAEAEPDWRTRLAALGPQDAAGALRLSRAEMRHLDQIVICLDALDTPARAAAEYGAEIATAAHLITGALSPMPWAETGAEIARGTAAIFPLRAKDLLARGLKPGPHMGKALQAARAAWLASDFSLDKADLIEKALE